MTTKTEIREFIKQTREELRRVEAALKANEEVTDVAIDMAGTAGTVEALCADYDQERVGRNYWHEKHGVPNYSPCNS